jgi:hypothetical protein
MALKTCKNPKCYKAGRPQHTDSFGSDRRTADGKQARCRHCNATYRRNKYRSLTVREKKKLSLVKYGITVKEYVSLLKKQRGRCAICRSKDPGGQWKNKTFFVDHCHDTDKVRGLLCCRCNAGLGYFMDSAYLIFYAYKYLSQHGSWRLRKRK